MAAIGLVLAFVALASVTWLPSFFEASATSAFDETAQDRGVADAEHMAHIFYYSIWAPVQEARPGLTFQETVHPSMMDIFSTRSSFGLDVSNVNVWSTYGEPVWLGDPNTDTPSPAQEEWFRSLAVSGTPMSILASVDSRDVIRTFVPLRDAAPDSGKVGNIIGILETDRDVTIALGIASANGRSLGQRVGYIAAALAVIIGMVSLLALRVHQSRLKASAKVGQQGIRQTEAQASQSTKLAAMGELVASVAHELNNPLTAIWGVSQLLETRELQEPEASEVNLIMREAERMSRIVQNLLSFARASNSEKTEASINAAISSALELRQYHFMINNITVDSRLDESLPKTIADPHKIQQVILNLVTNAEHAILKVSNSGALVVETKQVANEIVITVSDDGPGMSKETASHIFDPFYTTKAAGDGTGLGLAITETIVQEHAGTISVESEIGLGTTFTIRIPIATEAMRASAPATTQQSGATETQSVTNEDDDPIRDLAGRTG